MWCQAIQNLCTDWHWMHAMWFHNFTIVSFFKGPRNTIYFNETWFLLDLIHIHFWHHKDVSNIFLRHEQSILKVLSIFKQTSSNVSILAKKKKIDYHAFNVNLFLPSTYLEGRLYAIKGGSANILDKRSFDFKNPDCLWVWFRLCTYSMRIVCEVGCDSGVLCFLSSRGIVPGSLEVPFAFVLIPHLSCSHSRGL